MATEKYRILIIDDDANMSKTLADILRAKKYEVIVAGDGGEGLALLRENPVNLVLVDLGLPDMPGLDVLKRIKEDYSVTQAIVLTGNTTLDSAIQATERGAFTYILKPYEIERLLLHIRRAIEKQQLGEELRISRQMLENVTQGITESILLLSTDCRILWANKAASAQTALKMDELVGNYCYVATHNRQSPCDSAAEPCPMDELLATGKSRTAQHVHFDKGGNKHFTEINVYPIKDSTGEITELVHVSRDVTERVTMEQEIADKVIQLEASLARVKQLEGIIPICSYCKQIRDDSEKWQQMEAYISQHSEACFSHGICPECYEKQLIELEALKKLRKLGPC